MTEMQLEIDDIKIYPCYAAQEPKLEKMLLKEQYFEETGHLQSPVILDSQGYLVDGYINYLVARKHGLQSIPYRYAMRQALYMGAAGNPYWPCIGWGSGAGTHCVRHQGRHSGKGRGLCRGWPGTA